MARIMDDLRMDPNFTEPGAKRRKISGYDDDKAWSSSDGLAFTRMSPLERTQLHNELNDDKRWYRETFAFTRATEIEITCAENGWEIDEETGGFLTYDDETGEMVPVD